MSWLCRSVPVLDEVLSLQPVSPPAGAGESGFAKAFAAFADPAYLTCRNSGHQSVVLYIGGHHGAGAYHGAAADGMTAHYRAVRTEGRALAHARTRVNPVHRKVRPRGVYVGEHAGWTAEDIVFQLDTFVNGNIVLDAYAIAYAYAGTDIDVLSQGAILPNHGTLLNVAEMPYSGTGANRYILIDVTALMYKPVLHYLSKCSRGVRPRLQ